MAGRQRLTFSLGDCCPGARVFILCPADNRELVAFSGQTETLFGPSEGHDSAIINANFEVQWTPKFSTFVGYQGQLGRDRYNANAVTGGISFSF